MAQPLRDRQAFSLVITLPTVPSIHRPSPLNRPPTAPAFAVTLSHAPIVESQGRPAPGPGLDARVWHWADENGCSAWAAALAALPEARLAFISLQGPLGAGKTTLVRHLLRALGVSGRIKSPTYAVMEPYTLPGGTPAAHFDFYRFSDPREWLDAGFRDVFAQPGLKLAEWPEQAGDLLPTPDLSITLNPVDEHQRQVQVHAGTALGRRLLAGLPEALPT